jgi:predicted RND superfamily exporter protein
MQKIPSQSKVLRRTSIYFISRKSLRWIHYVLLLTHRNSMRHPALWTGSILAVLLIIYFNIGKLKVELSAEDMDARGLPSAHAYQELKEYFKEKPNVTVVTRSRTGQWTESQLCELRSYVNYDLANQVNIHAVSSSFSIREAKFEDKILYYPRYIQLDCKNSSDKVVPLDKIKSSLWGKIFVGRSNDIVINISFEETENFKYGSFDPAALDDIKHRLAHKFGQNLEFFYLGNAEYISEVLYGMDTTQWINLVFCLMLLVLCRLSFGTWLSGLIYNTNLIFGFSLLMALKAMVGSTSDALSDSLFMILGIAALEDFIFVSTLMVKDGFKKAHRRLILPSAMTSLTTAVGFISLTVSDLASIQKLGFWAAIGSALEWIILFCYTPAIYSLFKMKGSWVKSGKAMGLRWANKIQLNTLSFKKSKILLLVYVFAILGAYFVNTNEHFYSIFSRDKQIRQTLEYISETRSWQSSTSLFFDVGVNDEHVRRVIDEISKYKFVKHIESGILAMDELNANIPADVKPLVKIEWGANESYERYEDKTGRRRILVYLDSLDVDGVGAAVSSLRGFCKARQCQVASGLVKHLDLLSLVPKTLYESFFVSIIYVSLIIIWICLAVNASHQILPILLSSFWGPALMFLVVIIFQMPLNFLTSVFASVLVGLAGDNAINFLLVDKNKGISKGLSELAGGATVCLSIMSLSALLFLFSYFSPPKTFGLLLFFGLIATLFGDVWILRSFGTTPVENEKK